MGYFVAKIPISDPTGRIVDVEFDVHEGAQPGRPSYPTRERAQDAADALARAITAGAVPKLNAERAARAAKLGRS